jgi:hypothetical protein
MIHRGINIDILDMTVDELKMAIKLIDEELKGRQEEDSRPKALEYIDTTNIQNLAKENVEHIYKYGCDMKDIEYWCFEAVMEVVYGPDFWNWHNKMVK